MPSITRVHIGRVADEVFTLCGLTLSVQDHMDAWKHAAENVSCAGCLAVYDSNRNVR